MWIFSGGSQAKVRKAQCCNTCLFYDLDDFDIGKCNLDNTKEEKIVLNHNVCGFFERNEDTSL